MLRIALAQVNTTTGDLEGNGALVRQAVREGRAKGADLIAFPEMVMTGYPPDDLLLNKGFLRDSDRALKEVATSVQGISAIIGCVEQDPGGSLYNAAAVVSEGRIRAIYRKHELPNYGVFDERRFFEPGSEILIAKIGSHIFGVTICEDLWSDEGPHATCAAAGASMIVNINASPYHAGKGRERKDLLVKRAKENDLAFAYVNSVGGNDEIIFDGQSMALSVAGTLIARASQFREELLLFDIDPPARPYDGAPRAALVDLGSGHGVPRPPLDPRVADELTALIEHWPRRRLRPAVAALLVECNVADHEPDSRDGDSRESAQRPALKRLEGRADNGRLRHRSSPVGGPSWPRTCHRGSGR
jgi:NAD+ synthase (glutamine-hydrolysing)